MTKVSPRVIVTAVGLIALLLVVLDFMLFGQQTTPVSRGIPDYNGVRPS